ncbi:MAG: hypothetical protein JRN06_10035 [Nitrososphaerota archaeon]|nr:hypothetical protein [Nitrososphaerota archaeon]MDG7024926.1 hypothetical protein [Nitrososphaerota archaeon]
MRREGVRFRNDVVIGVGGKETMAEDPSGNPMELDVAMQDIAEHELGRRLGLWHTAQSSDLMNHFSGSFDAVRHPSTLNLYALYQLSGAHQVDQVASYYTLPGSMGYALSPAYSGATTTMSSTTSALSTTSSSASSTIASTAATESSQSASSTTSVTSASTTPNSSTSGETGIPEFPVSFFAAVLFAAAVALTYFAIRKSS